MQTINEQIAALQEQLRGLDQDKAFGELDREAYWAKDARIRKEINRLREQQQSNMYSADPTPEQAALVRLKNRVLFAIEPYQNRVSRKDYNALLIALKFCTGANQVEALYKTWQQKLAFKHIAKLPDLDKPMPKPGTQNQYKKAA